MLKHYSVTNTYLMYMAPCMFSMLCVNIYLYKSLLTLYRRDWRMGCSVKSALISEDGVPCHMLLLASVPYARPKQALTYIYTMFCSFLFCMSMCA